MFTKALKLDQADPLRSFRDEFHVSEGQIYLCGHSLGPMLRCVPKRLSDVLHKEYASDLVGAWNSADWIRLPENLGGKIAELIGADSDEVIVCDSTTINLYKGLSVALEINSYRNVILTDNENFPADLYVAQGIRNAELRVVPREAILDNMSEEVAVVMLTHSNYRTSKLYDMDLITKRAHEKGALVLFDLAHSAGVMPIALNACSVDIAVGCTYKYLNGGPGAPGYIYIAKCHHQGGFPEIYGWMGHRSPFEFSGKYQPADGIKKMLSGTPPVLSLKVLEVALDFHLEAKIEDVREKSLKLGDFLIELLDQYCPDLELISPRKGTERGSHIAYTHPAAYVIKCLLEESGIIVDYRKPECLRFGLSPLYSTFEEVYRVANILSKLLLSKNDLLKKKFKKERVT